jgi:hypothetical protein
VFDDNPNQDRAAPPHILRQEVIRSGVMMPLDDTLMGSYFEYFHVCWLVNVTVDVPPIMQQQPIDTLAHDLDRVLFKYAQLVPFIYMCLSIISVPEFTGCKTPDLEFTISPLGSRKSQRSMTLPLSAWQGSLKVRVMRYTRPPLPIQFLLKISSRNYALWHYEKIDVLLDQPPHYQECFVTSTFYSQNIRT